MKNILTVLFLFISVLCSAQKKILKLFSLEKEVKLHQVDSQYANESLVYIKDYRAINYREKNNVLINYISYLEYETNHKIIKFQDEVGLKAGNTLSIPLRPSSKLIRLNVRTISPEGIVKDFDISNLKSIVSDKGYNVKKFAVEGLEIGGELEYLYTIEKDGGSYGRIYYTNKYPIQDFQFKFYVNNVNYKVKTYNGLPKFNYEGSELVSKGKNIDPVRKGERYRTQLKRIDYVNRESKISWEKLAKRIPYVYDAGEQHTRVRKFLKDLFLKGKTQEEKIRLIENKIKNTIVLENSNDENYSIISSIIKTKLSNKKGLIKLYAECFKIAKIPFKYAMVCSRFDGFIDEKFPHPMDFDYPIIYLSDLAKYINPLNVTMRMGFPDFEYGGSRAFLVGSETYSSVFTEPAIFSDHRFMTLPIINAKQNTTKTRTKAYLNEDLDGLIFEYEDETAGYTSFPKRMFVQQITEKGDLDEYIIRGVDDIKIDSYEFINKDIDSSNMNDLPFICNAKLSSESLVENLDDELFIHLGKLIGTQSRLKSEENRVNEAILQYPKLYHHNISLRIPEGYSCGNLDQLSKNLYLTYDNGDSMYFKMKYTLENGYLIIEIEEGYDSIFISEEMYDDYRSVVNSAADFNAFVLVLEKK